MEILKQALTDFLEKKSNIDLKEIKRELKINGNEEELLLERCLKALEYGGIIFQDDKGRYSLLSKSLSLIQGKVHFLTSGDAIITSNDNTEVFISKDNAKGLLEKDIVLVNNLRMDKKNNIYGILYKIVKRNLEQISCEVVFENGKNTLIPYNSKCKSEIKIDQKTLDKYGVGEILLIGLDEKELYDGYLIKKLGHKDEPDIDEKTIAYDHGFETDYSNKYLKELEQIPTKVDSEKEIKKRRDLRGKNLFTIDGKDTKDIDDSVGIEVLPNGNYKLYVSIADVSHYIKDNTAICNEAFRRATSVYMNDTCIPMFHPKISNGICSLHPGVDRLTKTCELIISPEGEVLSYDIYKSIIHSKKKMTYEDVNKILIDGKDVCGYEDFKDDLLIMNELSKKLNIQKEKRGYLNFNREEIKTKGKGYNIEFEKRTQQDAEKLIENFMLLANEAVAEYMTYRGLPSIYRVHESPDKDKVLNFVEMLNNMGFHFKTCKNVTSKKYMQNLVNELMNRDDLDKGIYSELLLISTMKRAKYSNYNLGHYGLALKNYTHFTSPIRRYADLQIHKLLDLYLNLPNIDYNELDKFLGEVANQCTKMSLEADKAEREAKNMRMAEYMEHHIGEEFDGVVTSIGARNLNVRTSDGITGTINYSNLFDDNYVYYYEENKIVGKNTGNTYTLGSPITFTVMDASKKNRTINFMVGKKKELKESKVYKRKRKHTN